MGSPVVHFEVLGRDGEALQRFYGEVFGWRIDAANPMGYGVVDTDSDGRGIQGGVAAASEGEGWVTFYVEVEDLDETLREIEARGGRRLAGPMQVPGGPTLAIFADPEGHPIGLVRAEDGGEPPKAA